MSLNKSSDLELGKKYALFNNNIINIINKINTANIIDPKKPIDLIAILKAIKSPQTPDDLSSSSPHFNDELKNLIVSANKSLNEAGENKYQYIELIEGEIRQAEAKKTSTNNPSFSFDQVGGAYPQGNPEMQGWNF